MVCPSCGPGAAFPFSPYIVLGNTSKSSCCVLYLTEVRVVIIWVLLALRLSLMIGLPFRPAALSTPKELTSTKTRQSTTCKSSLGLRLCLKACNIMSVILGGQWCIWTDRRRMHIMTHGQISVILKLDSNTMAHTPQVYFIVLYIMEN